MVQTRNEAGWPPLKGKITGISFDNSQTVLIYFLNVVSIQTSHQHIHESPGFV